MKRKIIDALGFILFVAFYILIIPYLFISGGLIRMKRYLWYVIDSVHDRQPKQYQDKF